MYMNIFNEYVFLNVKFLFIDLRVENVEIYFFCL